MRSLRSANPNKKTMKIWQKTAESKIVNLNAHLHFLQDTLRENCHKINDLEQYVRRCMVEISNISVKPEESTKLIITALATNMNINNFSYDNDVDMAHRLHSKLSPPPIIVMFHSRTKRNEFYDKSKALRNITLKDLDLNFEENANIFVNESLTIQNSILFKKVRDTCKKNNFKFHWTYNGKILCKKNTKSNTIVIKDEEDLQAIK